MAGICLLTTSCIEKKQENGGVDKTATDEPFSVEGVIFEKQLGGDNIDNGNDIIMTDDGGFLIAGYTFSKGAGNADAYLVKCGSGGEVQWDRTYGWGENDQVFSVVKTSDGGYVAAGRTESGGPDKRDVYIIKVDDTGNKLWEKIYGGETTQDEANCIIRTSDGGYMAGGMTFSNRNGGDIYILKLASNGSREWEKTFGGKAKDFANQIQQTDDGGFIVVGVGGEKQDVYVLKLDGKGDVLWEKMIGGANFDVGNYIVQTGDKGYILAGITQPVQNQKVDVYIVKLKPDGEIQWEREIGGEDHSGAQVVRELDDGGYIVVGTTKNNANKMDNVFLLELDPDGNTRWMETFGGKHIAYGNGVVVPRQGRYVFVGYIYTKKSDEDVDCNIYFVGYERR
ncbi:MAG: hypothetical protein JW881_20105 [Spirochaetales bacterium]|nr:hypothetical protein [Spirochaetales bacterium]